MTSRIAILIVVASGMALGCNSTSTSTPGPLGESFGLAYRKNVEGMTADPTAPQQNTAPVLGAGPGTAVRVSENYHENQKAITQERRREASGIVKIRER